MKAVALTRDLPVSDPQCFVDVDLPDAQPGPRDSQAVKTFADQDIHGNAAVLCLAVGAVIAC